MVECWEGNGMDGEFGFEIMGFLGDVTDTANRLRDVAVAI